MSESKITIITPFCAKTRDDYLFARVQRFIAREATAEGISRLIVDFGSPQHIVETLDALCRGHGIQFLALNRQGEPFSAGACRNAGAQFATTEFITFQDVDLTAPTSLYKRLVRKLVDIPPHFNHLECIPCLYLTESGTEEYESLDAEEAQERFLQYYEESDAQRVHVYAPATSSIVVRRAFYLAMGGVRPQFFGHGYEDFELMNRLAWKANKFIRPHDFYSHDYKYSSLEYRGYRTYFSLFGRQNMAAGLFFAHLYHPTPAVEGYAKRSAANRQLFEQFVKGLDQEQDLPPALCDRGSRHTTLALCGRDTVPMRSIRMVIPYLGRVLYKDPTEFSDNQAFLSYVSENSVDRVLFLTPYGNEKRLSLYELCRSAGIPYFVFDRGALPGSWFFDPCGFNADSESYARARWDRALSTAEREAAEIYVNRLTSSDVTLEENGERVGVENLRAKYSLHGKKVLFVPLQRPSDSVIKYFAGAAKSVDHFCFVLSQLALTLPKDWRIVVKRHPLEEVMPPVPGAIVVSPSTHVYDLLAMSDAVLVINSGVGLLSLLFGKPTYNLGKAFYSHEGLSQQVRDAEDIANRLAGPVKPLTDAVLRFVHYLVNDFYSFAKTDYKKVVDGQSSRSVAVNLDFSEMRLPGLARASFSWRSEPVKKSSPLYDFYRSYISAMGGERQKVEKGSGDRSVPRVPSGATATAVLAGSGRPGANQKAGQQPTGQPKTASRARRKMAKLFRNPRLFFIDAVKNRLA